MPLLQCSSARWSPGCLMGVSVFLPSSASGTLWPCVHPQILFCWWAQQSLCCLFTMSTMSHSTLRIPAPQPSIKIHVFGVSTATLYFGSKQFQAFVLVWIFHSPCLVWTSCTANKLLVDVAIHHLWTWNTRSYPHTLYLFYNLAMPSTSLLLTGHLPISLSRVPFTHCTYLYCFKPTTWRLPPHLLNSPDSMKSSLMPLSFLLPRLSLTSWCVLGSFIPWAVNGCHLCIWCPSPMEKGIIVVITVAWSSAQC